MLRKSIRKIAASAALATVLVTGMAVAAPQPAEAAVASCTNGRCTVWFSQSETRAISQFRIPGIPPVVGRLAGPLAIGLKGHQWFAKQYANRNMCSAFRLSIYPWEGQGYAGYACSWR